MVVTDRNLKIRRRVFPNAEAVVFKNVRGFVSLPILLRKLLRYLKPKQLEVLVYLWLRSDQYGLCYPTVEEIADELGQQNTSRIRKTVRDLEEMSFLSTSVQRGRTYFLVHDPRHAVAKLRKRGKLRNDEFDEIKDLLDMLKLPPIKE